ATIRCQAGARWRVALALLSVTDFLQAVTCAAGLVWSVKMEDSPIWLFDVISWLTLFGGVVVLVTATIDLSRRIAFDWLHHTGVVVWLALASSGLLWSLVNRFSN